MGEIQLPVVIKIREKRSWRIVLNEAPNRQRPHKVTIAFTRQDQWPQTPTPTGYARWIRSDEIEFAVGGSPVELTSGSAARPAVHGTDPSSRCLCAASHQRPGVAREDRDLFHGRGTSSEFLPVPLTAAGLRWLPTDAHDGASSIWRSPIDGTTPVRLLTQAGSIFAFDWSHDGNQMALRTGAQPIDLVLIEDTGRR